MYSTWYENVVSGRKKGILASFALAVFALLSIIYLFAYFLRVLAYKLRFRKVRKLPRKVISVGNLTVGGTGKTPFVEAVVRMIREKKYNPVILSRGYGARDGKPSDEFLVLKENLPRVSHYTQPDRYRAGMTAIEKDNPDVFVLDDGFQHWRLERDLDIVLVDALNPFGYGWISPRGMLREPLGALRRADMIVITRSDQVEQRILEMLKASLRKLNGEAPLLVARHEIRHIRSIHTQKKRDRNYLEDKKVLGFCGIGNPRAFHGLLSHIGAQVASFHAFRDHFQYSSEVVNLMSEEARLLGCTALVTTQKDGVKLREYKTEPEILELLIEVKIVEGIGELQERITRLLEAS